MADKRTRSDDIIGSPTEAGTVPELIRCCAQQRNGIAAGGLRAETFTVSPRFVRHGGQTMATHKYLQAARVVKRLPWWWEYGELRRAVVVGLEAAVGDLAERDRQQPVGA